jgi:hypothetical protein
VELDRAPVVVHRRARVLRYAAIQFLVLVGVAMALYPGGTPFDPAATRYQLAGNFLSDLGATRAWSGEPNRVSSVLFSLALASLGAALIAFAWSWRRFACARSRAAGAGHASAVLGTLSGLAFVGVAVTPFDVALMLHNTFVIAAFALLLGYVASLMVVMARNGATRAQNGANAAYLVLVLGYVALVLFGPRLGSAHGHLVQVVGQKVIAFGSMVHVIALTSLL